MIYLASPYSDLDRKVELVRYHSAVFIAKELTLMGLSVYSPIVHCHPIKVLAQEAGQKLDGSYRTWREHAIWGLKNCEELTVAMMLNWDKSIGVQAEIDLAQQLGITVDRITRERFNNLIERAEEHGTHVVHSIQA